MASKKNKENITKELLASLSSEVINSQCAYVIDENFDSSVLPVLEKFTNITVITNRYDQYQTCLNAGLDTYFNDFDFTALNKTFEVVIYAISKERSVSHHIINQAFLNIEYGSELILAGTNNQGIKTYLKNGAKLFGTRPEINVLGNGARVGTFTKKNDNKEALLDSKNYTELQECTGKITETGFFSKPGQFGWNKEDLGSFLLLETLQSALHKPAPDTKILDLGCGYGYLSLFFASHGLTNITATDNNAAAILSCRKNLESFDIPSEQVIADDCATSIYNKFDIIVCNPPFHQGFQIEGDLTTKFISTSATKLASKGTAYFVVNEFIPVPKIANNYFSTVTELLHHQGFKVYALKKPI